MEPPAKIEKRFRPLFGQGGDNAGIVHVCEGNYTHVFDAARAESLYRGVLMPNVFVDRLGEITRLACAHEGSYSIVLSERILKVASPKEIRALVAHEIKHLYQYPGSNREEHHANEFDADRASLEATSLVVAQDLLMKSFLLCQKKSQQYPQKALFSWIALGKNLFDPKVDLTRQFESDETDKHPGLVERLDAMREYERSFNHD